MKHDKLNEESDTVTHYDQSIEDNYDQSRPKKNGLDSVISTTAPSTLEEDDVMLFVEMKYCTICHIE